MTLQRRVTRSITVAVGLAVLVALGIAYLVVRDQLRGAVDDQVRTVAAALAERAGELPAPLPPATQARPGRDGQLSLADGGLGPYVAVETEAGQRLDRGLGQGLTLPIDATDRAVRRGDVLLRDRRVDGRHVRTATARGPGRLVEVARPVDDIDRVLDRLGLVLLAVGLGVVGAAALIGRSIGRGLVAPLREVAEAAQHVGETDDLGRRLVRRTPDEIGVLVERFNTMLDRLEASRLALDASAAAQRQLVADASHELRTPVTSLRTNIEVLLEGGRLTDGQRAGLLADVREQTEELSRLVADVIELARGDMPLEDLQDVRLDELAAEAVDRAARMAQGVEVRLTCVPVVVDGAPERLGRALNNLIDNAVGHSRPGGTVEVGVTADGTVTVTDHGDGLHDEDVPFLFDRFYRGARARERPGTGLGLAIVKQAAEAHGGSVEAANAAGGGAVFILRLPARAGPEDLGGTALAPGLTPSRPAS